ncbi:MAG TPA: transcriptional regulator [Flavobacterium sp.]|uniref:transcriptional regulator n=2 Tax=Flavobacterium TaxID=237 RepID=UPI000E8C5209|nr:MULTISPECIES: transcriptional regulator [unclassified Flavobacterium]HBI01802.1 transcriptional regulator [Flavobacterium sp.]HRE76797.1 transcriptional regulator [Flavobacterium sp.]
MNYIKHLTGFFEKVVLDKTLNPTHVSLYMALFQFWNCNRFKNPISINRDEVMRISKISSKATYHKCLKNLHSLGYINYEPSYNPFKGSHVILFNFSEDLKPAPKSERKLKNEPLIESVSEQALNKSCTSSETGTEQAVVPSINYINNINSSNNKNVANLNEQAKKFEEINNSDPRAMLEQAKHLKNEKIKEEKSSAKKEEKEMQNFNSAFTNSDENQIKNSWQKSSAKKEKDVDGFVIPSKAEVSPLKMATPTTEEIKTYFQANNFPELEAQKFFNYFSSVGWLVGGKTPMINWQAAAQNWILNSVNFKDNTTNSPPIRPQHLNTTTDKNYAEPL